LSRQTVSVKVDTEGSGLTQGEYELEQLRLLYVSLTRAKKALVISRPLKIKRGQVAALGLERRSAGSQFWQTLKQCRFFEDVPAGHLPDSISTSEWQGIRLGTDS
jgi:ATP-dependent exoDNAse (exonuclease V) beta subunit